MTTRFLAIVALAISIACGAVTASAQGLTGVSVVDVQRVMRESAAAKSIQGQIEKQRVAYQQEISKQENVLRSAEQELTQQRSLISPEAFADRRRQFEQKVGNLQRDVANRKRELDKSFSAAMSTVEGSVREIIEQLVVERKLTLILIKSQAIYNAPDLDLTDEVMKRLNARLPSVKVLPAKAEPKGKAPSSGK